MSPSQSKSIRGLEVGTKAPDFKLNTTADQALEVMV